MGAMLYNRYDIITQSAAINQLGQNLVGWCRVICRRWRKGKFI